MSKHAIVVLTNSEGPEHNGRMITALKLANNFKKAGVGFDLWFDGMGVTWVAKFVDRNEESHPFFKNYGHYFDAVKEQIKVCNMCARRFDVHARVSELGLPIMGEGKDHGDLSEFVINGGQIMTF